MPTVGTWDWKEQPDWHKINEALKTEPIKEIHFVDDTRSDTEAVVIGVSGAEEAQKFWDADMPPDDPEDFFEDWIRILCPSE